MSSGAPTRDKLCRTRIKRSKTGGLRARWHLYGFRSCRSYLCSIAPSTGSRATRPRHCGNSAIRHRSCLLCGLEIVGHWPIAGSPAPYRQLRRHTSSQRASLAKRKGTLPYSRAVVANVSKSTTMKRCAFCGGRLGLISHREGSLRFCKQAHKSADLQRQRQQQKAAGRRRMRFDFLTRRAVTSTGMAGG